MATATARRAGVAPSNYRTDVLPRADRARLASLLDGRDKARITRTTGVTHKANPRRWYALSVCEAVRQRQMGKAEAQRFFALLNVDITEARLGYRWYVERLNGAAKGRAHKRATSQVVENERKLVRA